MKILLSSDDRLQFPPRKNQVRAEWAAIYIEPVVGSGERLAIGVAVANTDGFLVAPVVALNRLSCLYGKEADALVYAAELAVNHINNALASKGIEALHFWQAPMEGISIGQIRMGAGSSLEEIARTGLTASSSLVEKLADVDQLALPSEEFSTNRLEQLIKERVVARMASLETAFTRRFQPNLNIRPATIGFVGHRIAANFGLLLPGRLSIQVKDAKAKLWDLAQVQEYVQNKEFNLSSGLNRFELLMYRVKDDDPSYSERQIEEVQKAVNELEAEADRKEIRCRALTSHEAIADEILVAEAA